MKRIFVLAVGTAVIDELRKRSETRFGAGS
jgi:hypothetical protein